MNCEYTIRVVEQNDFTLVLPLKRRTYVANKPIDEDIDIMALVDCKVLIGGREFAYTQRVRQKTYTMRRKQKRSKWWRAIDFAHHL